MKKQISDKTFDLLKLAVKKIYWTTHDVIKKPTLKNSGYCPTCDRRVTFVSRGDWLRDKYICTSCLSKPRERALMITVENYFPEWRNLIVHESSPCNRGASLRLARECDEYIATQFFPDEESGSIVNGIRCENLEALMFEDNSIDLHITQDVMEHVFNPSEVFREIARTLKPGGAHIFTVPLVNKNKPSKKRAEMDEGGKISHLLPPLFHGNPISGDGSLVTYDWGLDICKYIFDSSGLYTNVIYMDDISRGLRAEYIETLITFKPLN